MMIVLICPDICQLVAGMVAETAKPFNKKSSYHLIRYQRYTINLLIIQYLLGIATMIATAIAPTVVWL